MDWTMVKLALLVSRIVGAVALDTLILAVAVAGPVTTHPWVPSLGEAAMIFVQVAPPSLDMSMLTLPEIPTDVQVIVWVVPTFQLSPPLGAVTVMVWMMLKLALLVSSTAGLLTLETLILAVAVAGAVTNQL
jgi:hypothetical protein